MPAVFDLMGSPETYRGFYPVTRQEPIGDVARLEPIGNPASYYRGLDEPQEETPAEEWEEPAVTSSAPTPSTPAPSTPAPSTPAPGTPPPSQAESAMTPCTMTGVVFAALFVVGVVGVMATAYTRPEWVMCFTSDTPHAMP